jgi:hypothetical protein
MLHPVDAGDHYFTSTRGVGTRQRKTHMKRLLAIGIGTLYFEGFGWFGHTVSHFTNG